MSDLISRQQAIVAIEQHKTAVLEGHKWDEGIEYGYAAAHRHLVDIIEQLPSAQPERNKGEWINKGRIIRCNKCKIGYAAVKGMKSALTYNFCPNCGADMRGEQDE